MVFETVRRARHRILANEALRHAAYSVSAALAAGTCGTWRTAPSPYLVAQRVDHNLKLADTLSTSLFFAPADQDARSSDTRYAQWSQAERIAAGVDPRHAIPIRMPASEEHRVGKE